MSSARKVSDSTVRRLSYYLRILREIDREGTQTVSSERLAELGGLTSAQVRKDLSFFGNFGVRGRGYDVGALREALERILGLDRSWRTVVVGAGRLGSALASYPEFRSQGFQGSVFYQGFGESALAVQTGDGVDEVRNRRVVYFLGNQQPPPNPDIPRANWKRI